MWITSFFRLLTCLQRFETLKKVRPGKINMSQMFLGGFMCILDRESMIQDVEQVITSFFKLLTCLRRFEALKQSASWKKCPCPSNF